MSTVVGFLRHLMDSQAIHHHVQKKSERMDMVHLVRYFEIVYFSMENSGLCFRTYQM